MNKRSHNQGTVFQDASTGRWVAEVSAGYDETGKRKRIRRKARTKTEALAKLKEEKPDLAIIDVMMPVMNGYETIDAIRKDGTHHFPILVMSAIQPPRAKMEEQQWAGFLKKPFSLRDLVDTVTRLTPA